MLASPAETGVAQALSPNSPLLIFYLENDIFGGTDKHYTNAAKVTWLSASLGQDSPARKITNLGRYLPFWNASKLADTSMHMAFSLGQNIFSRDIEQSSLIVDDRPYAGWSYFSSAIQWRKMMSFKTFEISLGIVGPSSLAEESQKIVHNWLSGSEKPMGWSNQLSDEAGLMVTWQYGHNQS